MRPITFAMLAALVPAAAGAQAPLADSFPPVVAPADIRGLVPGQRVYVSAFQGDCVRPVVVHGTVAGWSGDTMTVDLEQRGTILPGEQLAFPVRTIHRLHLSLGKPSKRPRTFLARLRGDGERWVEVKRPAGVPLERSCRRPVPPPLSGMSR